MSDNAEEIANESFSQFYKSKTDLFWTATALAALAAVLFLAFVNWRGIVLANQSAAAVREELSRLRRLARLLDEAETGQRGYLLTGRTRYLVPYTFAIQQIPIEMPALQRELTSREEHASSAELSRVFAAKLEELKRSVELRKEQGLEAALAVVLTDNGQTLMERARATIERLEKQINLDEEARAREVSIRARDGALVTSAACITLFVLFAVANIQVRRERALAEAANRAKSVFLASMSHELRTPLNAIIGYSEMLVEEAADAEQTALIPDLSKIQAAGKHLLMLINSVLDLSKIEAGKMDLFVETFSIAQLVREVSEVITPLAEKNQNRLKVVVDPLSGAMRTDQTKLRQTLYNLLSNACKFTQKGTVEFEAAREHSDNGEQVVFKVIDSGIGMTPEQLRRLFQPFTQADASTTRRFGGTGLGLAISQRFIQLLGGNISVESRPGIGSTFTVRIPLQPATAELREALPLNGPSAVANEDIVLSIDDEPSVSDLLSRVLAKHGFRVYPAYTGEEGIRLARKLRPVAITLDVMMPGMDGWTVLAILKADAELRDIPVVMLTIADSRNLGYTLGATDYLTKPLSREQLVPVLLRYRSVVSSTTALVVEDDPDSRNLLRRSLEGEGWKVQEAENGRVALERIAENRPGVILLDLMMPEMDGFEFIAALRQTPEGKNIPVIVITAKDVTPEERLRLNGQVSRVLQKGAFEVQDLLAEVGQLVVTRVRMKAPAGESDGNPVR